jgi:hypothetical protein
MVDNRSMGICRPLTMIRSTWSRSGVATTTSPVGPTLYALQDLDLDAVDHGEGPADGAHVATIPAGLVAHHGAAQPVDQLGRGYVINQEIQVPGIDRQSMEGEGGASADSPPAISNNGQLAQGGTPRWC